MTASWQVFHTQLNIPSPSSLVRLLPAQAPGKQWPPPWASLEHSVITGILQRYKDRNAFFQVCFYHNGVGQEVWLACLPPNLGSYPCEGAGPLIPSPTLFLPHEDPCHIVPFRVKFPPSLSLSLSQNAPHLALSPSLPLSHPSLVTPILLKEGPKGKAKWCPEWHTDACGFDQFLLELPVPSSLLAPTWKRGLHLVLHGLDLRLKS